jgi:hypothetical protein
MALNLEVMNGKTDREKVGIACINVLSWNSFGGIEHNHKKK